MSREIILTLIIDLVGFRALISLCTKVKEIIENYYGVEHSLSIQ